MKIAVQLFGHMRTFEKCAPNLKKNLLDLYDCDVFIHTWDKLDHQSPVAYEKTPQSIHHVDLDYYDQITSLYSPKKLHIQTQLSFLQIDKDNSSSDPSILSTINRANNMLYSMLSVNQSRIQYSKESGQKYDYVIFIRPDILLRECFMIDDYIKEFSYLPNSIISFINFPKITRKMGRFDINYFANDIFFFLKSDMADEFLNIKNYYKSNFKHYSEIHPESDFSTAILFHEYLVKKNIIPRYYSFPYSIIRNNPLYNIHLGENISEILTFTCIKDSSDRVKKYRAIIKALSICLLISIILIAIII